VAVRADDLSLHGALGVVFAIVASADDRPTERLDTGCEVRAARVVLEADQSAPLPVQVRLDQDIADVSLGAGHAAHVEQAGAGQLLTVHGRVAAAEQLVPAAD
jgi:hypothetical protein